MLDLPLIRLQYEILNKSLKDIASDEGTSFTLLCKEAEANGWRQYWPDPPKVDHDTEDASEIMALEADQFIDLGRRRLKVYSLAKEMLLAHRYLTLECSIIDAANTLLTMQSAELGTTGVKQLSALFKDLTSGSNLANLASMAITTDDNGLPTVVIRDLSGRR